MPGEEDLKDNLVFFGYYLGIASHIMTSSTPKYLKIFHNNPVTFIACGGYHSLAITKEKKLYGWGEARLG